MPLSPLLQNRQRGTTLIETLVALFILAIGLLGVISMQARGLKSNQRAQYSSVANIIAADMVDQIYAFDDVDEIDDNDDFNGIDTEQNRVTGDPGCYIGSGCTSLAAQVEQAKWDWQQEIDKNLPSGLGQVSYAAATGIYTITVMWNNESISPTPTGRGCSGDPKKDLACYSIQMRL